MRTTALRVVAVVVGVALLGLLFLVATNERAVVAYVEGPDGQVLQVSLTCAGIAEGGGRAGDEDVVPTGRDVGSAPEGVEVYDLDADLYEACPSEGPVWLGVLALLAVLVAGATVWVVLWLGRRPPPT